MSSYMEASSYINEGELRMVRTGYALRQALLILEDLANEFRDLNPEASGLLDVVRQQILWDLEVDAE